MADKQLEEKTFGEFSVRVPQPEHLVSDAIKKARSIVVENVDDIAGNSSRPEDEDGQ